MTPEEKCSELLNLDLGSRRAFADRQATLIAWGTRRDERGNLIGRKPWPLHGWYTDEDFCRAYNTACAMADRAEAAEKRCEELEAIVRRVAVGLKAHRDPLSSEGRRIDHYDLSNAIANAVFDTAAEAAQKGGA